jgi:hypothetical protein
VILATPSAKSEQDKLMPGGHRGQQCKKKGLTPIPILASVEF